MDDEPVLVDKAAPNEAGGERRPADPEVAAEVPPELLEDRLRIAARETPAGRCILSSSRGYMAGSQTGLPMTRERPPRRPWNWFVDWVRRVLTDTEDDGRYRSGLGAVFGACIVTIPLLFGMLDAETVLIALLVGSIVAAPLWRFFGEALDRPATIISYVAFLVASVVVMRQLPGLAFFVFLGGFTFTVSVLRFVNGWRNPVPLPPASEPEPGPIQPVLVLALVVPLLALVVVIVIGIAMERGMFR